MSFSSDEVRRYSRHLLLPGFGVKGQKALKASRVLVVGAGGLGSPAALYLAAAGVGTLGVIDFDVVDLSNLQRQVLHGTREVGHKKVESAQARLADLNSDITVVAHPERLTRDNALQLFANYDLVLDGTDTWATRYLINDACVLTKRPLVSASVFRFEGQVSIFGAPNGPCYRCLFPSPPPPGVVPSCGEGGVLGAITGVMGTVQATEAIKYLCALGEPLVGRLLVFDALEMSFRSLKVKRDPTCVVCGDAPSVTTLQDYEAFCGLTVPDTVPEVTPVELVKRLADVLLVDVREVGERDINFIAGSVSVPMGELSARLGELPTDRDLVVYCKVGERSARAVATLQRLGFTRVFNLKGGIDAWLDDIEDEQARY